MKAHLPARIIRNWVCSFRTYKLLRDHNLHLLGHLLELLEMLDHFDQLLWVLLVEGLDGLRVLQRHFHLVLLLQVQAQSVEDYQALLFGQLRLCACFLGVLIGGCLPTA